ncbi:TraI/MobA(P) family conjugative relaxase [Pseudomonas fulva]|uniref:TraI/MobA(P) family conjugative relaxase n=1 Tax=Pseudomonas fulva TaxID=47880 RepID=UPI002DBE4925|nr:TraI/MobA(P) family conjugative relaxase [Pseudomonas fulva]MEB8059298.1 relaxase/mobilization nuclease domain-containing protein [Pseudomonas fulva]
MNVIIPKKRRDGRTSFVKLVGYISVRDDRPHHDGVLEESPSNNASKTVNAVFDRLVEYIDRSSQSEGESSQILELEDGRQRLLVGGVPCETNCFSWETAAAEMNLIASRNTHCKDPVYHFILSWQEHESPTNAQIFESAKDCIAALKMEGHQYVTAIHFDTDNVHCHVAVNRVNPVTSKAQNLWKDAEKLQKTCRILEKKYGFAEDNGSWIWSDKDTLIPAPFRFPGAPQGAGKKQSFSDEESLFHYAERTVREGLDEVIGRNLATWDDIHHKLYERGLGLREQGNGMVIYDVLEPDAVPIKASTIHPSLTKARLEPHIGKFTPAPLFDSGDLLEGRFGHLQTYNPKLNLRDKDARDERRQARAVARQELKDRYRDYRSSWNRVDLQVPQREQAIRLRCRSMKLQARRSVTDPLLRKLMYRVAEFEQLKGMAELRLQLRQERAALKKNGLDRPLAYRSWVEGEAVLGDTAAISQLRGWAYKDKRNSRSQAHHNDAVILAAPADDVGAFDVPGHTTQVRRDGTVEYLRYGQVAVVDRGESIEIKAGFDDTDDLANYSLAVAIQAQKSGEMAQLLGHESAINQVIVSSLRYAEQTDGQALKLTDSAQQRLLEIAAYQNALTPHPVGEMEDDDWVSEAQITPIQPPRL